MRFSIVINLLIGFVTYRVSMYTVGIKYNKSSLLIFSVGHMSQLIFLIPQLNPMICESFFMWHSYVVIIWDLVSQYGESLDHTNSLQPHSRENTRFSTNRAIREQIVGILKNSIIKEVIPKSHLTFAKSPTQVIRCTKI